MAGIGGMMGMDHPPVWNTYLATADADATSKAVQDAGGTVVAPAMDVMDFGRMAFAQAPERRRLRLLAGRHAHRRRARQRARFADVERVHDPRLRQCEGLLRQVFGYTYTEIGGGRLPVRMIELDGNTVAGIGVLPAEVPAHVPPHWRVYFAVDDCDATVARR